VYIDPSFAGSPKSGTLTNPYSDIPALTSNTTYLLKGGSTLTTANSYSANANNVKISTYGTGRANVISSYTGKCFYLDGFGNTYENLNVTSTSPSQTGASVLNFRNEGGLCVINNCVTSGGLQGITINNYYHVVGTMGIGVAHITNCTITNTQRDGNYIDDLDSLIFTGNTVSNVNLNVVNDYGGDCLQTETVNFVVVDRCTFDHSSAAGKFCMINNGYKKVWASNSSFIGSDESVTYKSNDGQYRNEACIYTGGSNDNSMNYYISNCKLKNARKAVWVNADSLFVKNVIIEGSFHGFDGGGTAQYLYNVDFINVKAAVVAYASTKVIKNSIFYNVDTLFAGALMTGSNNLSNRAVTAAMKTYVGSDILVSTDPAFVNYGAENFCIQSNSPCVNHGSNVGVNYDFINTLRPQGGAYDIGAYEFVGTIIDSLAPTIPMALTSGGITQTGFTLSWTPSTDDKGVTGYEVFRNGVSIGTPATNSFSVSGLTCGTAYGLTVRARDAAGNWSAQSTVLNVTTVSCGSDTQAPGVPAGLASANVTQTGFTLSWTASTDNVGVTGYEVFREGVSIGTSSATSFSVSGLTCGSYYGMTVRARDASGNWSAQSSELDVNTSACSIQGTNIAPTGTGKIWQNLSTAMDNTGAVTSTGVNDGNLSSDIVFTDASSQYWQAAGATWTTAQSNITSVSFYNGTYNTGTSNGYYEATMKVQSSADGTTWTDVSGWTIAPACPYSSACSNQLYTISGTGLNNVKGIRVAGQVHLSATSGSWAVSVKEVQVMSGSAPDTKAPGIPTALAASNITGSSFSLSWTASTDNIGVTSYDVYTNGVLTTNVTGTSASLTGLTPYVTYAITVKARDAAGNVSATSTALNVRTLDTQAPSTPAGLISSNITSSGFTLSWTASTDNAGVTGYDVYKNGTLAVSVTTTSASLTGLTASTVYAMTVKAKDAAGNVTSASIALNVTTSATSTLPAPWLTQDVGAVGVTGNATYNNGTFNLVGSGSDIWDDIDQFRFVYQTLNGDGEIKARVVSQTNSNAWAKAGVMVRESLATGAKEAATVVTPSNGVLFQRRLITNSGADYSTAVTGRVAPLWVRIVRSGSIITSYYSTNGTAWTLIGTDNITMATAYIGLCISSHANTTTSAGVFDNVTVTSPLKSSEIADGITNITNEAVVLYPNPASDFVNIELSERSIVRIVDINGKLRFIKTLEPGLTRILLNLESGLFILQAVGENNKVQTSKLMVK